MKPVTVIVMLPLMTGDTLLGVIYVILVGSDLTVTVWEAEAMPLTVRVSETEPVEGKFSVMHLIYVAATEITWHLLPPEKLMP